MRDASQVFQTEKTEITTHMESQCGEHADMVLMAAQEISNLLVKVQILLSARGIISGSSSIGRALLCQSRGCRIILGLPLHKGYPL